MEVNNPRLDCLSCEHHISPDGSGGIITGMILWRDDILKEYHMCQLLLCNKPELMRAIKEYEMENGLR